MKKTIAIVSVLVVVFLCSSFNVFASSAVTPSRIYNGHFTFLDGDVTVDYNTVIYDTTIIDHDYNFDNGRTYYGTSNQQYPANPYNWWSEGHSNLYDVTVHHTLTFRNYGDYLAYANPYISFVPDMSFEQGYQPMGCYVDLLTDDFTLYTVYNGQFRFICSNPDYQYKGRFAIPKDGQVSFSFDVHYIYYYEQGSVNNGNTTTHGIIPSSTGITMNSGSFIYPDSFTFTNIDSSANNLVNMWRIDQWLSIISGKMPDTNQAYIDNRQDSIDVGTNSNAAQTQSNTNHQTELSYFNQTNTALNNSGISNYSFDNEQIGGIGAVSNDFTSVWNSLGSWTSVYIFSLTLSLGLAIIRHVRPIQRSKEE